jgi:hypothetical protein
MMEEMSCTVSSCPHWESSQSPTQEEATLRAIQKIRDPGLKHKGKLRHWWSYLLNLS